MLDPARRNKSDSGRRAYLSGQAGEDSAIRAYEDLGVRLLAQRWRGASGEIDLILQAPETLIFCEVKTCRSFAAAAHRISQAQMQRIYQTAEEFLGQQPQGALTPSRFDAALVDGFGRVEIIANAFGQ